MSVGRSNLVDPRAASLDTFYAAKDSARVLSLAADMVSNSAPGDMNWTVGKLYEGIALLSQTPPKPNQAAIILDSLIAFDFTNKPGRDHYILGAVKWRIYAARLSGDTQRGPLLVQWVQSQDFRADLKTDFLKTYLPSPTAPTQ